MSELWLSAFLASARTSGVILWRYHSAQSPSLDRGIFRLCRSWSCRVGKCLLRIDWPQQQMLPLLQTGCLLSSMGYSARKRESRFMGVVVTPPCAQSLLDDMQPPTKRKRTEETKLHTINIRCHLLTDSLSLVPMLRCSTKTREH